MPDLTEKTLEEFAAGLASKAPVPGGGGAAAYSASMAAALCAMACRLTSGKKQFEACEAEIQELLARSDSIRARLCELVSEDAAVFEPLSKAWKIPKDDPSRARIMEECTLKAASVPMETLRLCAETARICAELMDGKVTELMVSDAGTACELARGAAAASLFNVEVNTASLRDRAAAEELNAEAARLYGECEELTASVFRAVTERLKR
ncbi:MAG: cyclodeaminase/cyclohydrolase family protein [Firmicutes bacterium]|nr:cyclodeaminase/cyclohydrolase family protein [Bacillota bacterium]